MNRRWWQEEGEELGKSTWDIADQLFNDQAWRRNNARYLSNIYEGRDEEFFQSLGVGAERATTLNYNLSRSATDTVIAEIAGRQKPVPKFQTSGADWKTKRKAKRLESHVRSILGQQQSSYLNAWELGEDVFTDAAESEGTGCVKVYGTDDGYVRMDRVFAHELYIDPIEARYGNPKSLFHVYLIDKEQALWQFAEDPDLELTDRERQEISYAIESASTDTELVKWSATVGLDRALVGEQIRIVEAWRVSCYGKPGKHVYSINGKLMLEEEWTREDFPIAFVNWARERKGFWGVSLTEQGLSIHNEVNENAEKLQERFRVCGAKRTYYQRGSVDLEDLQQNEAESLIPYTGDRPPVEVTPKPINEAEMNWLNDAFQKFFEVNGVSQMRASARKEPGVTAGVAIRTLNDMQTARFALRAKAYENFFLRLTNQIITCCKEMNSAGIKVKVKKGEEIDWGDVELPEDVFDISVAPTSSLPNDPAGRMQMTQELYSSGIIGLETYKQLLGWPDLEKEMNLQTAQTKWMEQLIDRMLDDGYYEPPDGHIIDKPRALIQVSQAYFEALYNGAPEEPLALMRLYMQEISKLIDEMEQEIALKQMKLQNQLIAQQEMQQGVAPAGGQGARPPVAVG